MTKSQTSLASKPAKPPRFGAWGMVTCIRGEHAGLVMEYDDDTNEDDRGKRGDFIIVYADVFSPYAVMPRKWFRSATDEEMTANDDKYIKKLRREYKRAPTVVLDVNKRPIQVGDELLDEDGTWQVVEALRVTPRNGSVVLSRVKKDPAVTYRAIRSAEPHTETTRAIKPRRSPNTEPTTKEA